MQLMRVGVCLILLLLFHSETEAKVFEKKPYLQNVSQHSITIMWQSSLHVAGKVTLKTASPRIFETKAERIHEVVIDELSPGTRYEFLVESDGESHYGEFATAPKTGSPFSFVVFGDSRSNANAHKRVVERIRQEVPDFLLGTGDIVNKGASTEDWDTLFKIEGDLLAQTVMFPSLGNHDRQGRGRTASNYRKFFSLPVNSPDPERYYSFTYGNARFIILDSNTHSFALTDQTAWIEQQLQAAKLDRSIRHIFVTMHHPPFSISLHGGQSELREAWTPLFDKYQVDAVFSGHDHVYSRAERNGVKYFVSGGGGAPLYGRKKTSSELDKNTVRFFERVNHHLRVQVVGDHIEITAVRADGTVMEVLSWGQRSQAKDAELVAFNSAVIPAVGKGRVQNTTIQAAPAQPSSTLGGLGILGILGTIMTLAAGTIAVWSWRQ